MLNEYLRGHASAIKDDTSFLHKATRSSVADCESRVSDPDLTASLSSLLLCYVLVNIKTEKR